MTDTYISVKELAERTHVTTQYIYKILHTHLSPYAKKINKKTMINVIAIDLIQNGFTATNTTDTTTDLQPNENEPLQPLQPTNTTSCTTAENEHIKALQSLIDELRADKEELKRDKERLHQDKDNLQQEILKWQQLYLEQKKQLQLLQAPAEARKDSAVIDVIPDTNTQQEPTAEKQKRGLLHRLFKKG